MSSSSEILAEVHFWLEQIRIIRIAPREFAYIRVFALTLYLIYAQIA